MITDLGLLRLRICMAADAITVNGVGLTCLGYTPDKVEPPTFYPGEIEMARTAAGQRTFGGQRGYRVTATVLTSTSDDLAGQQMLDALLSEGGGSDIVSAIEADKTLGGLCSDLNVESVDGYRLYTVGQSLYYGARLRILVLG